MVRIFTHSISCLLTLVISTVAALAGQGQSTTSSGSRLLQFGRRRGGKVAEKDPVEAKFEQHLLNEMETFSAQVQEVKVQSHNSNLQVLGTMTAPTQKQQYCKDATHLQARAGHLIDSLQFLNRDKHLQPKIEQVQHEILWIKIILESCQHIAHAGARPGPDVHIVRVGSVHRPLKK